MRSTLLRAAAWSPLLALAWWVVVEGRPGSWVVGAPVVALASLVAAAAVPAPRRGVRPLALLAFVGAFAAESARGGWDVARRAWARRPPLAAGFATMRTGLPEGAARVLLADVVSLLPGTLTVDLVGDELLVHALEVGPGLEAEVRALERRVAALLGVEVAE